MSIEAIGISTSGENSIKSRWGITANEYNYAGKQIDLQDLMVAVSKRRATVVEGEVKPLSDRIQIRNKRLEALGEALAELTKAQAGFKPDASPNLDQSGWLSKKTGELLVSLGYVPVIYQAGDGEPGNRPHDEEKRADFYYGVWKDLYSANRKTIEGMLSRVKSEIDNLNNAAQLDLSRLQQLVDRRDESFTAATTLMSEISETRDNTIRNL